MRVCIYQPQYLPRLHYVNRVLDSDVFVCLSGAQYTKSLVHTEGGHRERHRSYQSDTPVLLPGGVHLLTVPVRSGPARSLSDTPVDYATNWPARHLQTIRAAYGKARHFDRYFDELRELLRSRPVTLGELNTRTILWALTRVLEIDLAVHDLEVARVDALLPAGGARLGRIVTDAALGVPRPDGRQQGTEWTVRICSALGATEYLYGGTAGAGYMDLTAYAAFGIEPVQQHWACVPYPQRFGTGFTPNLSIVDLLMNQGATGARVLLDVPEQVSEATGAGRKS